MMATEDMEADCKTVNAQAQQYAELFSAVFGDSESDDDFNWNLGRDDEAGSESDALYIWTKIDEVEGLWHCQDFLPVKQQLALLKKIDSEGWFSDPLHNQAMRFGDLPGWAIELCDLIQSRIAAIACEKRFELENYPLTDGLQRSIGSRAPLPDKILEREPLFDQMIVNSYQPGEGISAHVDLLRFEDGIAIVSLESTCVMSFQKVDNPSNGVIDDTISKRNDSLEHELFSPVYELDTKTAAAKKVDVLLSPGDLIIIHGPARYNWTHEINRDRNNQFWQGKPLLQQHRVSVTLRRLCLQTDA